MTMKAVIITSGIDYSVFCFRPGHVCLLIDGKQKWYPDSEIEIVYD